MAYFVGNVYSEEMLQDTQIHIIMPQDGRRYVWKSNPKTLVLLHGLSDNASTWVRRTAIERYAERYNLAVVIPEVQRSWYFDMVNGVNASSYITRELPVIVDKLFHLSTTREDMLLAGLSMGGYGALRCVLEAPEVYGYCGAFSGAYDINKVIDQSLENNAQPLLKGVKEETLAIAGKEGAVPQQYLIPHILEKRLKEGGEVAKIYMVCGTEDFLYPQTEEIKGLCQEKLKDFYYEEWPGIHEWDVWDKAIERMLKLFLGEGRKDQ